MRRALPLPLLLRCAALLAGLLLARAGFAQPLTLAVSRGPVSLPVYIADSKQFFAQEGLDLRMLKCGSGRECLKLMNDGLADAATAAELAVLLAGAQRQDLAIIGTISSSSHQIKLIARRSAGIQAPADLAGKRIGTVLGTSAQYFLVNWLLYHGIEPGRVSLQSLAPEQLGAALHDLQGDALLLPNPRVYLQHFSLVTTRGKLQEREDQLLRLLRALQRAEQFIADEPLKARQVLGTRLNMTVAEAEQYLGEHDYRLRLDQSLANTLAAEARWAQREGLLPAAAASAPQPLVEPRLLGRVAPAAVTIVR